MPILPTNPFPDLVLEEYRDHRTWSSRMRWMHFIGEMLIGYFEPFGGWSERGYKPDRLVLLYPIEPILCTQVVVCRPGKHSPVICLPRAEPGVEAISENTENRLSPIQIASEKLFQWTKKAIAAGREPFEVTASLRWEDGTEFVLQNVSFPKMDYGDGSRRSVRSFLGYQLFLHLLEASGFAPTPERFFGGGWSATAFGARKLYLAEVLADPEARLRAMYILGRCEY